MVAETGSPAAIGYGGSLKKQPQLQPCLQSHEDGAVHASPQLLRARSIECSQDRRTTDPFFYPTTVTPLTAYGLTTADQTPPLRTGLRDQPALPAHRDSPKEDVPPLFVNAPLQSYLDQPEDMRMLQEQNDILAKQVQALEHAKSLAAVQSAQAMQKIRARQDLLRREALSAIHNSKEMQAEFGQPLHQAAHSSPGRASSSAEPVRAESASPSPGSPSIPEQPLWKPEVWSDIPQRSSSASAPPHLKPEDAVHERAAAGATAGRSVGQSGQVAPSSKAKPASNRFEAASDPQQASRPQAGDLAKSDITAMANRILTAHNVGPSSGSSQDGTSQLPLSTLPNGTPYVDAMGNPLGPTKGRELPNIKDDVPTLPDVRKLEIQKPSELGQGPGATMQAQASSSQQLLSSLELQAIRSSHPEPLESARTHETTVVGPKMEAASTVSGTHPRVVHERAPNSARALQATVLATPPGASTYRESEVGVAEAGAGAGPIGELPSVSAAVAVIESAKAPSQSVVSTPSQQMQIGGAADAAAGAAVLVPPSSPLLDTPVGNRSSQKEDPPSSQRPLRRDYSAPLENGMRGRRRAEEANARRERSAPRAVSSTQLQGASDAAPLGDSSKGPLRNLPPDASEELKAELEECLDMIRWCGDSLTRENLQDLKNTTRPAAVVKDVLEAVALLIGQPETRWDKLKRLIAAPTFLERIQRLSFQQSVSRDTFRKLRDRLQHPDFDEEQIKQVCVPVVPLAMWCRAIGVYLSKTKFRGGPEIRPVAGAGAAGTMQPHGQLDQLPPNESYLVFDPDIRNMSDDELRCVQNLTISRPNVGTISFHGITDCTNLDFERIVRLEIGEVLVYPDSSTKPDIGIGLNKAATVTMYECWPPNGRKHLQDPKSQERYRNKIKTMTEEKHAAAARFLDYDCNTGIWKFSVEHF